MSRQDQRDLRPKRELPPITAVLMFAVAALALAAMILSNGFALQ